MTGGNGPPVRTDELTDYSSEEVKKSLGKYKRRPGEKPENWLVCLMEEGADTVLLDDGDAKKGVQHFLGAGGYWQSYVPGLAVLLKPLYKVT